MQIADAHRKPGGTKRLEVCVDVVQLAHEVQSNQFVPGRLLRKQYLCMLLEHWIHLFGRRLLKQGRRRRWNVLWLVLLHDEPPVVVEAHFTGLPRRDLQLFEAHLFHEDVSVLALPNTFVFEPADFVSDFVDEGSLKGIQTCRKLQLFDEGIVLKLLQQVQEVGPLLGVSHLLLTQLLCRAPCLVRFLKLRLACALPDSLGLLSLQVLLTVLLFF